MEETLEPQFADEFYHRGLSRKDRGEHEQAVADFDEAIRLDDEHERAHFDRGVCRTALGDHRGRWRTSPSNCVCNRKTGRRTSTRVFAYSVWGRTPKPWNTSPRRGGSIPMIPIPPPRAASV